MARIEPRTLDDAAGAYAGARRRYAAAKASADAAYERLQASPETLEYQIDWNVARRAESAANWRLKWAEEAYREAGGYVGDGDE